MVKKSNIRLVSIKDRNGDALLVAGDQPAPHVKDLLAERRKRAMTAMGSYVADLPQPPARRIVETDPGNDWGTKLLAWVAVLAATIGSVLLIAEFVR